ncbi:hypothetical protein GCM10022291_20330 [Postechiella marina]|uniref:Uncharacterized protein n=1 Tax=Postechiella marina TaxID=943941 RepID=A0ABP8C9W4_9FLAO
MFKNTLILLILTWSVYITAQEKDSILLKNGIDKPSLISTHHFGIFSSRINQNFKIAPPQKTMLTISNINGNNFHPFVETHLPKNAQVREDLSKVIWHDRRFNFIDQEQTPADYFNIIIDAVIKEFRADVNIPISKNQELGITLRTYLITKGKYPFSVFTSDETIEWFHSNIAGGEDPYGRRYYGLNQVHFEYNDRNGNNLTLNNGDFFVGGLEFNHFYYPSFLTNKAKHIYFNFGSHVGVNTSKYNKSIDLGLSLNAVKKIILKNKNEFNFGAGISALRKNVINFKDVIDLGNNPYLGTFEGHIEYTKYTKKKHYHAFGINYRLQTRYNKLKETDYFRLLGKWQEINGGWQNGVTTLYATLTDWNVIYTYAHNKYKVSIYFKEDLKVTNAPDFQTGISLMFPISKKIK